MDPNTNWSTLHLSDGQLLFYAKTDMVWTRNNSGDVSLSQTARDFTVVTSRNVLFTDGGSFTVNAVSDIVLSPSAGFITLTAPNLYAIQLTSQMNNGLGSVGISLSMGSKQGDILISHGGSGEIRLEHSSTGRIKIATTGAGAVDISSGSGFVTLAAASKKVSIQGVPIEPTGGLTGYVLTQQLDGSFIPAAATAFPGLADGKIWIGDSGGAAVARTLSGDVTVSNTGVTAIGALKVTNAMIAATTIDLTAKVTGILPVANGGTGANTLLIHGLLIGNTTGAVTVSAVGTNGQMLVGQTAADPLWKTVTGDISLLSTGATTVIAWSGKGLAAAFAGPTQYDIPMYSATGTGTWEVQSGAWSDYTPQVDQGANTNIAKTVNEARYIQVGKMVTVRVDVTMTAAGAAGTIIVSLPVTAVATSTVTPNGTYHASAAGTGTGGVTRLNSTTRVAFLNLSVAPPALLTAILANTNFIRFTCTYEAA